MGTLRNTLPSNKLKEDKKGKDFFSDLIMIREHWPKYLYFHHDCPYSQCQSSNFAWNNFNYPTHLKAQWSMQETHFHPWTLLLLIYYLSSSKSLWQPDVWTLSCENSGICTSFSMDLWKESGAGIYLNSGLKIASRIQACLWGTIPLLWWTAYSPNFISDKYILPICQRMGKFKNKLNTHKHTESPLGNK